MKTILAVLLTASLGLASLGVAIAAPVTNKKPPILTVKDGSVQTFAWEWKQAPAGGSAKVELLRLTSTYSQVAYTITLGDQSLPSGSINWVVRRIQWGDETDTYRLRTSWFDINGKFLRSSMSPIFKISTDDAPSIDLAPLEAVNLSSNTVVRIHWDANLPAGAKVAIVLEPVGQPGDPANITVATTANTGGYVWRINGIPPGSYNVRLFYVITEYSSDAAPCYGAYSDAVAVTVN